MTDVVFNLKNLDRFTKQMKSELDKHYAKIGVLSEGNQRDEDNFTNADLAAVHEFGSIKRKIPARSFLGLTEQIKGKEMSEFIDSQADNIFKRVMEGKSKIVIGKLAAKWMEYIHECFETEGFGTWVPMSDATYWKRFENASEKVQDSGNFEPKLLQDTGQLERSITYEVI